MCQIVAVYRIKQLWFLRESLSVGYVKVIEGDWPSGLPNHCCCYRWHQERHVIFRHEYVWPVNAWYPVLIEPALPSRIVAFYWQCWYFAQQVLHMGSYQHPVRVIYLDSW